MLGLPGAPRGKGLTPRAPRLPGGHLELSWGEPAQEGRDHERARPPWGPVSPTRPHPEDTRSCLSPPLSSLGQGVPCSLRFQVRTRRQPTRAHSPAACGAHPSPGGPLLGAPSSTSRRHGQGTPQRPALHGGLELDGKWPVGSSTPARPLCSEEGQLPRAAGWPR